MCLVIANEKEVEGRIARWDIEVWKVLEKTRWGSGELYTPYMLFVVGDLPCGIVAKGKPVIRFIPSLESCKDVLYGGAIHAYADTRDGILSLSECFGRGSRDSLLVRAVIPAGARYWVGSDGDVAAERLRLVEFVASNNRDYRDDLPTIKEWCEGRSF